MQGILDAFWQWALAGLSTGLGAIGSVVYQNRERSLENQRRLEGDDDDPSYEGLMNIASDTRAKVDSLEARMEREHREVMRKLEDIQDRQ